MISPASFEPSGPDRSFLEQGSTGRSMRDDARRVLPPDFKTIIPVDFGEIVLDLPDLAMVHH